MAGIKYSCRWTERLTQCNRDITMIIRLAQIEDLPAILAIYNQSIPSKQSTGDIQPLRLADRFAWFEEHRPDQHPIFVAEAEEGVVGWCSLSAYRPGREAFRFTREISYYIDFAHHRQGIAMGLVEHALAACPALQIKHVFAIVLEGNQASIGLLKRM